MRGDASVRSDRTAPSIQERVFSFMTAVQGQPGSRTSVAIQGPDSRIANPCASRVFVNLSGHEHYYRARGGATLGTDDCTCRR